MFTALSSASRARSPDARSTSWVADANDYLTPLPGSPALPVVSWPEDSDSQELDARQGLHWKTRTLVAWAAGRAFAWVDDEIRDIDRAWVALPCARHMAPGDLNPLHAITHAHAADRASAQRSLMPNRGCRRAGRAGCRLSYPGVAASADHALVFPFGEGSPVFVLSPLSAARLLSLLWLMLRSR
jgi:hypothetical protein